MPAILSSRSADERSDFFKMRFRNFAPYFARNAAILRTAVMSVPIFITVWRPAV